MLNWRSEYRDECPWWVIMFTQSGFGIDSESFKKINTRQEMIERCTKCKCITDCQKTLLFQTLMKDPEADRLALLSNQSLN